MKYMTWIFPLILVSISHANLIGFNNRHATTPLPKLAYNPPSLPIYSYRPTSSPSSLATNAPAITIIPTNRPSISSRPSFRSQTNKPTWIDPISTDAPSLVTRSRSPVSTKPTYKSIAPSIPEKFTWKPSNIPTVIFPSISQPPTYNPTNKQSSSGFNHICNTPLDGIFGSSTTTSTFISYYYRIQVKNDTYLLQTLSRLEMAINDALLPSFFPSQCLGLLTNSTTNSTVDLIVGVSTYPKDIPQSTEFMPCVDLEVTTGTVCYNVYGRLTLFSGVVAVSQSIFDYMHDGSHATIQRSMDSGALLYADTNIIRVTYLSNEPSSISPSEGVMVTLDRRGAVPVYGWVTLALLVGLIAAILTWVRKRRRYSEPP